MQKCRCVHLCPFILAVLSFSMHDLLPEAHETLVTYVVKGCIGVQELKTEMARADTNSVELSPAVYAQSITEYPRSNILSTAGSTDLLSSQTLLLPVDEIQGMLSSGFASNLDSNNAMPRPPYDTSHKTQSSAR